MAAPSRANSPFIGITFSPGQDQFTKKKAVPLQRRDGFAPLGKISAKLHFRRVMIWFNRPSVMLCWHCSSR